MLTANFNPFRKEKKKGFRYCTQTGSTNHLKNFCVFDCNYFLKKINNSNNDDNNKNIFFCSNNITK